MATKNDITGDALVSKTTNNDYRTGWDRIFAKKPVDAEPRLVNGQWVGKPLSDYPELRDEVVRKLKSGEITLS